MNVHKPGCGWLSRMVGGWLLAAAGTALVACGGGGVPGGSATTLRWGTTEVISTGELSDSAEPSTAFAADGTGYALWVQKVSNDARVVARRYVDGTWQEVQVVSRAGTSSTPAEPQVALTANGEAVAVWLEHVGNNPVVRGARTVNKKWQEPVLVSNLASFSLSGLKLVSDGEDDAIAVWRRVTAGVVFEVIGSPFLNNTFFPAVRVNFGDTNAESPSVAMAPNGNALIAWHQLDDDGGVERIHVATYSNGLFFDPVVVTDDEEFDAEFPAVAVGANGSATLAWVQEIDVSGALAVGVATASDFMAQNWSGAQVLPARKASNVSVTQDPLGTSTIVWRESEPLNNVFNSVKALRVGAHPLPAQLIETNDEGGGSVPVVASDASGGALVVWTQDFDPSPDTSLTKAVANRFDPVTGRWGVLERIDTGLPADSIGAGGPVLALFPGGQALAVWRQGKAEGFDIVFNSFR